MKTISLFLVSLSVLALAGCGGNCTACRAETDKAHMSAAQEADKAFTKDAAAHAESPAQPAK